MEHGMEQGRLFDLTPASAPERFATVEEARAAALACVRCDLARTRQRVVFGEGHEGARLMVVGEGPSEADDASGHPFSGPSGTPLARWLADLGLRREEVWLTNVVRCRPAALEGGRIKNRPPSVREAEACRVWLEHELAFIRPAVILGLGGSAGRALSGAEFKITQGRGRWFAGPHGIPTLVTYLPAYLMRLEEPALGRVQAQVDADLAAVRARLAGDPADPV
jgi:DNA polymerase